MLWSGSTAMVATVAVLATVAPSSAFSLPSLVATPHQHSEQPVESARTFRPQVEQGVYLNTFSSALLNLLSSLNMVQMASRYPAHPEAKLGGVGLGSGSVSFSKNVTVGNVGIGFPAGGITSSLAAFLALCAAIGAGLAALIAFVIPPLQIVNQILAIIAIALLVAYIIEDKHYKPKDYKDYDDVSGVYNVYEYTGSYGDDGYGSSGYGSDGYDTGYSDGYDRYDEDTPTPTSSSNSYAIDKSDKYGSPYAPPYNPPVKTAHDYSRTTEKKASTTPDSKPDPYAAVYPYTQRKGGDINDGSDETDEESNLIERRSMVPPSVLSGIGRIASAAIVGLGSLYEEKQ